MKSKTQSMRRKAKTSRGVDVMDRVVEAAKTLLSENWLDEVSITELAREAGIVRASLLLQFPNGWPDIANTILRTSRTPRTTSASFRLPTCWRIP